MVEEGEVVPSKELEPQKGAKIAKDMIVTQGSRSGTPLWCWMELLPLDSSIRDFQQGKAGYVANALEQSLMLP